MITLIEKLVKDHPGKWDEFLLDALWAYRMSPRSSTGLSPYSLTYGHDAMVPMEILAKSSRFALTNRLTWEEYTEGMMIALEDIDEVRMAALDRIRAQKKKVERTYNKKVKHRTYVEGELVWKAMLPL